MNRTQRSTGPMQNLAAIDVTPDPTSSTNGAGNSDSAIQLSEIVDEPTVVPQGDLAAYESDPEVDSQASNDSWDDYLSSCGIECAPGSAAMQPDFVGERLGVGGRYEVQEFIGRGGMGHVYLAIDRNRKDAKVAVKIPFSHLLSAPGIRDRFAREFEAMIELEHPHICRVLDTGSHANVPFLVLQNLASGNLRERYLNTSPNTFPRTVENLLSWLRPIGDALTFVHSRNYVHRDVKPENILFDGHGHAYLSDFGIVRVVNEQRDGRTERLTQHDSWLGTPGYIAPEVGTDRIIDGRVDLYALAAVAYVYLTDQPPVAGKAKEEIRLAQLSGTITPAHELNSAVPVAASDVLRQALAVNPDDRQESCSQFVQELADALGTAVPAVTFPAAPPVASHSRRPIVMGIVALAALGALLAVTFRRPDSRPPSPFVVPGETLKETTIVRPSIDPEVAAAARRHYDNALVYLADGEPDEAAREAARAIQLNPHEASYYETRGEALFRTGLVDEAISQYDRAIEFAAEPDYYADRGLCHLAANHPPQAEADFANAIKLDDGEPHYHAYRALAKLRQQDFRSAIESYTAALDRAKGQVSNAERAAWHNGRGFAYAQLEDGLREALDDANSAVTLQPEDARHYHNRAEIRERMNQLDSAKQDRATARRLETKN